MKKANKKTTVIAIVLVAAIAMMSFGFAAWTQTLTINGKVTTSATWDINITKIEVVDSSKAYSSLDPVADPIAPTGTTLPAKTVTFADADAPIFAVPGAWVKYKVTVKNSGTVDAKLTEQSFAFTSKSDEFTIIAPTGLAAGDVVKAGGECVFEYVVEANDDLTTDDFKAPGLKGEYTIQLDYEAIYAVDTYSAPTHAAH